MKFLVTTVCSFALATQSFAGTLVFEAEEEQEIIIQEEPMGSSNAAWIVPLLAVGVIGLAIASSGDDDDDEDEPEEIIEEREPICGDCLIEAQ